VSKVLVLRYQVSS